MPEINPAAGQVVADDLRAAFACLDHSVQTTARLVGTFMEASAGADLAPSSTQRALRSIGDSLAKVIDSRADMISAQRVMIAIKENSNIDVYDYGCWQLRGDAGQPREVASSPAMAA